MKLILRDVQGDIEVKEILNLNKDSEMIFFFLGQILRAKDIESIEEYLSKKVGKKVICLDARFREKIYGI